MKNTLKVLLVMFLLTSSFANANSVQDAESFLNALYKELAIRRDAVLLDAPSENEAMLGRVFMYKDPKCNLANSNYMKKGKYVGIAAFDTPIVLTDAVRTSKEPIKIGQYGMSKEFAAKIAAGFKGSESVSGEFNAETLVKLVSQVNIKFRVVKSEVDFAELHRRLETKNVNRSIIPDEYEGLLVPFVTYSITDFSYDQTSAKDIATKLGLNADFVEKFLGHLNAELSAKSRVDSTTNVKIDTSVVFAYKPNVLHWKHKKCSMFS